MEYTTLGTTDIKVSKICLGTMNMGEQNTEEDSHEQLDYSIDQGINFIDTAELYSVPPRQETQGSSEKIVGTWLKKRGKREDLVLGTKIAGPAEWTKYIREDVDYSAKSIKEAVEESLKRLQTDYVDLFQLHWPARRTNFFGVRGYRHSDKWEDNILSVIEGLEQVIKDGKVRHFGISNETPWGLMSYLKFSAALGKPRCISVQNPYNLLNRTYELGLAEMSIREKCGLLAYSPMAFGLLSGKYHKEPKPTDGRIALYPRMSRYNSTNTYEAAGKYMAVAEKHGLSFAQMSLSFVTNQPFVTSNIIGATKMEQLKENIGSIHLKLSKDILKEIDAVQEEIPNPAT